MDRRAWWATVRGVIKSQTRLKRLSMQAQWEIGKCPCDKEEVVPVWDLSKSMQTFALVKASREVHPDHSALHILSVHSRVGL